MKIRCLFDEMVDVNTLKHSPDNRNDHPKEQIERLAEILEFQGFRYPIKVSKQSGFITSGHGRVLAAKKNKWKKVPVNYQDYDNPMQEYADIQADNAIASWSQMNIPRIKIDLESMPEFDVKLLGIKDFEIEIEKVPECDEDEIPEKVEPKTRLGDIYQIGDHRLMCGDSTSIDAVEKLMDGNKADMVFTDPPYGYRYESNHQNKHKMLENDDKILDFLPCAYTVMKDPSAIFVFGSHQTIHQWRPLIDQHFTYKNLIVWKKNNWSMGDLTGAFAGQHELILFAHKGRVELRGERSRDVWEFDRDPPKDHPTQKPIELVEFAIEKVSDEKQNVLDLFGGSGSTLIACEKTNRKCYVMELDPHYCDVIVARWEKYTGKKAELL